PTFILSWFNRVAISLFSSPSAASKMIAALSRTRMEVERPRFIRSSWLRSLALSTMAAATLMPKIYTHSYNMQSVRRNTLAWYDQTLLWRYNTHPKAQKKWSGLGSVDKI